jgi:predicted nucleotidyltransferase
MLRGTSLPVPVDEQTIREFCVKNDVDELALFGSVLRDDFGPASDVDFLVRFKPGKRVSLIDLCRMEAVLAPLVGGRTVDLRTVGELHPRIRQRVLTEREVLYDASER